MTTRTGLPMESRPETFERLDAEALAALKARALPRCTAIDMVKVAAESTDLVEGERLMKIAGDYFAAFLVPSKPSRCVCCGWPLAGMMGSFTWGLQNGEGSCGRCHYPARAIHRVPEVGTLSYFIMQYHPDDLELRR